MNTAFAKLQHGLSDGHLEGPGKIGHLSKIRVDVTFITKRSPSRDASTNGLDAFDFEN